MTLEQYEKVLEEKRKALEATKASERKVEMDKAFEKMQLVENKKREEDVFIKLVRYLFREILGLSFLLLNPCLAHSLRRVGAYSWFCMGGACRARRKRKSKGMPLKERRSPERYGHD